MIGTGLLSVHRDETRIGNNDGAVKRRSVLYFLHLALVQ